MADRSKLVQGMVGNHSVDGLTLANGKKVTGYEHEITVGKVAGFNFKDAVGSIDNVVFTVECSGPNGSWSWEEVIAVANLQHKKALRLHDDSQS
jgi:hypothetical protein